MSEKDYKGPMRFAHRGLVQYAPENTLGAFEAAIDHGFEGMEIDVGVSLDGEIIVAHDSNFTRMTLGHPTGFSNKRLKDINWSDIVKTELPYANHMLPKELPPYSENECMAICPLLVMGQGGMDYETALSKDSRMAHLMRFADFDKWFSTRKEYVTVEIEVKARGIIPRMYEILKNSDNVDRYIIFSGETEIINEIQSFFKGHDKLNGLRLGANIRYLTDDKKNFVEKSELFEVGLNAEHISEDDIKWLKDRGINVFSNLGDYPEWWEKLISLDIMAFKTNYAEAFTAWYNQNK